MERATARRPRGRSLTSDRGEQRSFPTLRIYLLSLLGNCYPIMGRRILDRCGDQRRPRNMDVGSDPRESDRRTT